MRRREFLAGAALAARAEEPQKRLLLPTDTPNEHGFRIMWYNPVPPIDPASWRLEIKGLAAQPGRLSLAQLRSLPQVSQSSRMKCVQCWSSRATWGGFRYASLAALVKPLAKARAIRIDCADKWYEYLSIEELSNPRVLFALDMAGKPLPDNHGAPLRLIDPSKYGYKSAKLITSITFVEEGKGSMACDIGPYYSPTGEILAGYDTPLDLGGPKRKIRGGEITEY
jgi:sulfoxide reductase catalytic subunit YedY